MNYSIISNVENRYFLGGNFGASVFMATYIGLYGLGIIVYFACQLLTDSKDNHEDEIPSRFFSTFHHINQRQDIYSQLINKDWVKNAYEIYYSDQPLKSKIIEEKANQCLKKYHEKMESLKSRHNYYVTETLTPQTLTTIAYID